MKRDISKLIPSGRFSLGYLLVSLPVRLAYLFFYRRITIIGSDKIPKGGKVIFTANHQNSLMDALVLVCTTFHQSVFLARADIFKKPAIARILKFFKISPVYRMRDGMDTLDNNSGVFDSASDILNSGGYIGIFPEGNHAGFRRLRPLVKGAFRIAFQSAMKSSSNKPVWIQPLGIDYSSYQSPGSLQTICYAEPINVNDYLEAYKLNPAEAINKLKNELSVRIKQQIIHIGNETHYDFILHIRMLLLQSPLKKILGKDHKTAYRKTQSIITKSDALAETADAGFIEMKARFEEYIQCTKKLNINSFSIANKQNNFLIAIQLLYSIFIGLPVIIINDIIHFIPGRIAMRLSKIPKDTQFISSFMFVGGLVAYPLYYLILIGILVAIGVPALYSLSVFVGLPLLFLWKRISKPIMKRMLSKIRAIKLKRSDRQLFQKLYDFETIFADYLNAL
ncbi:MAG: hypothetical protein GX587_08265 [Bacteroidales bacterium]|nr:hypothetical protein [Bacteroidales bacterium]